MQIPLSENHWLLWDPKVCILFFKKHKYFLKVVHVLFVTFGHVSHSFSMHGTLRIMGILRLMEVLRLMEILRVMEVLRVL